jgi:hypothetical protein
MRSPAGFISAFFDPLKNPNAPTIGAATGGDASASVSFTPPANVGGSAITAYYAVSNPGQITSSGASSPVTVTGLTNGTAYTFNVWALNSYGPGAFSAATGSVTPEQLQRGLFAGGSTAAGDYASAISYISINSLGNALSFGNLTTTQSQGGGFGSSTRAVFCGGTGTGGGRTSVMSFVTIATTGNATSFGNLLQITGEIGGGSSNNTRGLLFGGLSSGFLAGIQYATIASAGNAISFGSLNQAKSNTATFASTTRAVMGGGYAGDPGNPFAYIGFVEISTTGNTSTFGSLTTPAFTFTGSSNNTRGVFAGSGSSGNVTNVIQYVTIASTGNSIDFGDLTANRGNLTSVSSPTRVVFDYGQVGGTVLANMDYIEIATTGNSVNFGNLNNTNKARLSASNCHGGI